MRQLIKSIIADAVGSHLDNFQRITADPASMSVIRYTSARPFVLHVNHTGPALTAGTVVWRTIVLAAGTLVRVPAVACSVRPVFGRRTR